MNRREICFNLIYKTASIEFIALSSMLTDFLIHKITKHPTRSPPVIIAYYYTILRVLSSIALVFVIHSSSGKCSIMVYIMKIFVLCLFSVWYWWRLLVYKLCYTYFNYQLLKSDFVLSFFLSHSRQRIRRKRDTHEQQRIGDNADSRRQFGRNKCDFHSCAHWCGVCCGCK